jgi:formyl-CoA transferase
VHSETLGDINLVGSPINMTGVSKKIRSATADAGAHTDEVLSSVGYTKEQLQQMRANGVI